MNIVFSFVVINFIKFQNIVGLGYNDISLCGTSSITSDILWYQLIPHC